MNCKTGLFAALLTATTFAFAGTPTDARRVEADFGNSVRNMINLQIYDLEAAQHASTEPVQGTDARKIDNALDVYRKDVSKPADIDKPIELQVTQ